MDFTYRVIEIMTQIFLFALGVGLAGLVVLYIVDVTQTKHAVRRNFPIVGRFR